MSWLTYSIFVIVGWGFWGFFSTLASRSIGSYEAVVYATVGSVVVVLGMLFFKGAPPITHTGGVFSAFIAGVFATLAALPYIAALSKGKAAIVVPLVALYPIVTLVLAFLFLGEAITLRQGIGVVLALLAMVLLGRA